jgi:hypothetical protein
MSIREERWIAAGSRIGFHYVGDVEMNTAGL